MGHKGALQGIGNVLGLAQMVVSQAYAYIKCMDLYT